MTACRCQCCGKAAETHPVAIVVPVKDYRGRPLDINAVQHLCVPCRRTVAHAEQAAKRAQVSQC